MTNKGIDRRELLKRTAGLMALTVGGGTPFLSSRAAYAQALSLAEQQLRTIGSAVTVQERILEDFKAKSGVGSTVGTASTFTDAQTKILSGATDFDCWETLAERLPSMILTGHAEPIQVSELKTWTGIRDTFTKVDPRFPRNEQNVGQIWTDESQTSLYMVPSVYNYDSVGFNPEVLSDEEANTWAAIFDPKWKGKSGLNTDPLIAFGIAIMAMNSLGLQDVRNPAQPTKEQIDETAKFLVSKKKEGQFRALWGDFGELVNYLASGEIVVCDAWQPAVMAVKAQGKACKYSVPKEGHRAWALGPMMVSGSNNRQAVTAYADYWLSGLPGVAVSEQGYYSPSQSVRDAMSPEKYAFWYEGKPWVGAEERGIKEGDLRDGGSLEQRASNVAYWHQWPTEYDYLIQKWDEFLSA